MQCELTMEELPELLHEHAYILWTLGMLRMPKWPRLLGLLSFLSIVSMRGPMGPPPHADGVLMPSALPSTVASPILPDWGLPAYNIMPARNRTSSSTIRRHQKADRILSEGFLTMRPCSSCTSQGLLCVLSPRDERCEQCYRFRRQCDLASPWAEDDRLGRKEKEL
jgi:hypothetical protein